MAYRYIPTGQDLQMLKQHIKNVSIKISILNKDMQPIDEIKGSVISDNYSINVDSDIRRTYSASIRVSKDYDMLDLYKKLWIDKMLQVYIGVEDIIKSEMVWYLFGTFTFDKVTYDIGSDSNVLNVNCIDLAAKYNGTLGGSLLDSVLIPAYNDETNEPSTIRGAMVSVITELAGIKKYSISDMDKTVPHDLEYGSGATIWEVISELRDLYAGWETFFDVDGTFVCQKIPTGVEDPTFLSNDVFNDLVIRENDIDDASAARNVSKLYGATIDYDLLCETVTVEKDTTLNNVYKFWTDYSYLKDNQLNLFKFNALPKQDIDTYFYYNGGNSALVKTNMSAVTDLDSWYYIENNIVKKQTPILEAVSYIWDLTDNEKPKLYIELGTIDWNLSDSSPYLIKWPVDARDARYIQINWTYQGVKKNLYITTSTVSSRYNWQPYTNYNFKKDEVYFIQREFSVLEYEERSYYRDDDGKKVYYYRTRTDRRHTDNIYTLKYLNETPVEVVEKTVFNLSSLGSVVFKNGDTIAFYAPEVSTPDLYLKYNNKTYYIRDDNGEPLMAGILRPGVLYVLKYSNEVFYYLGEQEIVVIAKEVLTAPTQEQREQDMKKYNCQNIVYTVDPTSQFAVEIIDERRTVYSDNDYAKIYTTTLAIERAVYENWKTTRLNSTATIDIVAIPWLMGNEKIEYTKKVDRTTASYLIKQITGSTKEWTQTLTLVKFYPLIPNAIQSKWV